MKRVLIVAALLVCSACGGGSPSAPTPSIPNVVGSYSGNITIAFPELGTSVVCPASTSVTQNGATVSIAPIILRGECNNLSIPVGQVTIDATGAILGSTSATSQESCGTYRATGSGGFFGRELQFSLTATSTTCFNFNFTARLTRA